MLRRVILLHCSGPQYLMYSEHQYNTLQFSVQYTILCAMLSLVCSAQFSDQCIFTYLLHILVCSGQHTVQCAV